GVGANQGVEYARDRLQLLEALAVRQQNRIGESSRGQSRTVQPPDEWIGHDEPPGRRACLIEQRWQALEDTRADGYGVLAGRRGDVDADGNHRLVSSHLADSARPWRASG